MTKAARSWPADKVERRPTASLVPYARNARTHSAEQIDQLAASMKEFGFTVPVLLDEEGGIIAGHGRVLAAKKLKLREIPCMVAVGWSAAQRAAYVIADNKLAMNAGWDEAILKLEIDDLKGMSFDIGLTGFAAADIDALFNPPVAPPHVDAADPAAPGSADPEDSEPISDGSLLALTDITVKEPRHVVALGEVWQVGPHVMCVASVMLDWARWSKHLTDGAIFCPYPGPFVPFSSRAKGVKLVMVHPDHYVAGHVLDRYADVHGAASVRKIEDAK